MNVREYVSGIDIKSGETQRGNCPSCGGNNTFTVSNIDGSVVYNCYKLGCKVTGAVHVGLTAAEIQLKLQRLDAQKVKPEVETMVIPEYVIKPSDDNVLMADFVDRWGLHGMQLYYDVKDRRAVFPILHKGRIIDAVGRALDGKQPKWLRYSGAASVYKSIYGEDEGVAVVVEDVISAIVVSLLCPGVTGVAILGTSLGPAHMEHLGEYKRIVIALDPDAVSKTIEFKREVEAWTGITTKALLLQDDIKYRKKKDIKALKEIVT